MAVVGIDAELVDYLEGVFAPVLDVDQGVVQRRAVVADESVDRAESAGGREDVGGDNFFEQAGELGIGEADAVEGLEFLAEVLLQAGAVANVRAVCVFEADELLNEAVLESLLPEHEALGSRGRVAVIRRRGHGGVGRRPGS